MTTITDNALAVRRLLDSPEGRRLAAEREADLLAVRKAKVVELARLATAHLKALPSLQAATAEASASVKAAQDALTAAHAEHLKAYQQERTSASAYDRARGQLESDLIATADPAIDGFIHYLSELWERTRRIPISTQGGNSDGRGGFEPVRTNAESVTGRLSAINNARESAELLRLEALTPDEVGKKLDALRASIPAVS